MILKSTRTIVTILALLANAACQLSIAQPSLVTLASSDFELNADGWKGTNNLGGAETLIWRAGGAASNSVGYASVSENQGDGALMYFVAPSKYLGDQHSAYNGLLVFDLRQFATSNLIPPDRLVLLGSTNLVLSFDLAVVPGTNWIAFAIPLNENVGWRVASSDLPFGSSNALASKQDVITVLRSLSLLWIRAEYSSANFDRGDLDNVALLGQPSGPVQPILSATTYAGVTISGAVGASYRIEYRGVLDAPDNWRELGGVVLPSSPYLFIDQSSPSASQRFYRAVLNQ